MNDWEEAAHIRALIREGKLPGSCINEDGTLGIDYAAIERQIRDPFLLEVILENERRANRSDPPTGC